MSYLMRSSLLRSIASKPTSRAFSLSARRSALNEDHPNDESKKASIDSHKNDALKNPKWKKELASNSEAAVKADREETDASEENISKLQKETAEAAEREKGKK